MSNNDVPFCLNRAREEVLMALRADSAVDEGTHRKLADHYMTQAVRTIEDEPEREYDWSSLRTDC